MTQIEKPDTRHADWDSSKILELSRSSFCDQILEHLLGTHETVSVRRFEAAASVRVGQFDDDMRVRISRVGKNDMNVVIRGALDPANRSNDLIDVEFFLANATIPGRTAFGW